MLIVFKVEILTCVALDQGKGPLHRYTICPLSASRHKSILYVQLYRTSPDNKLTRCHVVSFIPNETPGVREHAAET